MYYVYVQLLTLLVLFLGRVYEGQALNVIGQENGWVKINHNGQVRLCKWRIRIWRFF